MISASDFQYVCDLVRKNSAIVLEQGKDYLVEARLAPVARAEGFDSISSLVTKLRGTPKNGLHQAVVEALTTNETSFFRDVHPFELLKKEVLPDVIQRRGRERTLSIWSAACSTGQEPFTISMLLRESFPELSSWKVSILATDLSSQVLERAKTGTFKQLEVNRGLPAAYLVKYMERAGAEWRVRADIRSMVEFRQMNLIESWPTLPVFDVIFIRNVLIYFDLDTKREILRRAKGRLDSRGYLFLGGAETTLNIDDGFERAFAQSGGCYKLK